MVFKIYECDVVLTLEGINYEFIHVDSLQAEDPERTRLTRGANAGNKTGIVYKEGVKEAKTVTLNVLDIPMELHNLLLTAYDDQTRMDVSAISRKDGSSLTAKNSILSQRPVQLNLEEGPESMNVALLFETFDLEPKIKS